MVAITNAKAANAAKAKYDMAVTGTRSEDKKTAEALVNKAKGAVEEVQAYLNELNLKSPMDGEVATIIADPGELIAPGFPVVSLVNLENIWATFNIREDNLLCFRMGDAINVKIPALGTQEYPLKISYISPLGEFATWRATSASGEFDLKTFEIRARPVNPIPNLRPGMSAIITLKTSN